MCDVMLFYSCQFNSIPVFHRYIYFCLEYDNESTWMCHIINTGFKCPNYHGNIIISCKVLRAKTEFFTCPNSSPNSRRCSFLVVPWRQQACMLNAKSDIHLANCIIIQCDGTWCPSNGNTDDRIRPKSWYFAMRWCCPHSMLFRSYFYEYGVKWWNVRTGYPSDSILGQVKRQITAKQHVFNMSVLFICVLRVHGTFAGKYSFR